MKFNRFWFVCVTALLLQKNICHRHCSTYSIAMKCDMRPKNESRMVCFSFLFYLSFAFFSLRKENCRWAQSGWEKKKKLKTITYQRHRREDNRNRKSWWIKELNNAFEYFMNYFGNGPTIDTKQCKLSARHEIKFAFGIFWYLLEHL